MAATAPFSTASAAGSQEALERASWRTFDAEPTNGLAAAFMLAATMEFMSGGWEPVEFDGFGTSLLLPLERTELKDGRPAFAHLVDAENLIDIFISIETPDSVGREHRELLAAHTGWEEPYLLRRDDLGISTNNATPCSTICGRANDRGVAGSVPSSIM